METNQKPSFIEALKTKLAEPKNRIIKVTAVTLLALLLVNLFIPLMNLRSDLLFAIGVIGVVTTLVYYVNFIVKEIKNLFQ